MKKYTLEHQYILFLKRLNLSEDRMHEQQKKQLKETFFGCAGQIMILLRDELSELPEDEGIQHLENMMNEVGNFFLKSNNKLN